MPNRAADQSRYLGRRGRHPPVVLSCRLRRLVLSDHEPTSKISGGSNCTPRAWSLGTMPPSALRERPPDVLSMDCDISVLHSGVVKEIAYDDTFGIDAVRIGGCGAGKVHLRKVAGAIARLREPVLGGRYEAPSAH